MKHHALIIGGGIGGPALALFLKKVGISSTVYEAYENERAEVGISAGDETKVGGGFQVAPNGLAVLDQLGLAQKVIAGGAPIGRFRLVRPDGRLIAEFRNGRPEVNGFTAIACLRSVVGRILFEELAQQGIRTEFKKRFVDCSTQPDGGVVARFEDGTTAEGTFIVGADGMHSRVRAVAIPDAKPSRFDGLMGVAGLVELTPKFRAQLTEGAITFVLGSYGQFGYDRLNDTLFNYWTHFPMEKEPTKAELKAIDPEETRARLLERHGHWHEPIPSAIRATKPKDFKYGVLSFFPPLPRWHTKNVVLIGDAAHTMSPSTGLGASLAMEDAMFLANKLRSSTDLEAVFEAFEVARRPRLERVAGLVKERHARERTKLGKFQVALRDRMLSMTLPLVGERGLRWQYEHRIHWD